MQLSIQAQAMMTSVGLLILRLGIGGYMLTHGWAKVKMMFAGQAEMMGDPIGIGNWPTLIPLVFAEFVCAGLVLIGLVTRLAAVPPVVAMAVAAFVAHGADPWTMQTAAERFFDGETVYPFSKQPALMFLVPFLALVFTGGGRYSIDALVFPRRQAAPSDLAANEAHPLGKRR